MAGEREKVLSVKPGRFDKVGVASLRGPHGQCHNELCRFELVGQIYTMSHSPEHLFSLSPPPLLLLSEPADFTAAQLQQRPPDLAARAPSTPTTAWPRTFYAKTPMPSNPPPAPPSFASPPTLHRRTAPTTATRPGSPRAPSTSTTKPPRLFNFNNETPAPLRH
jgi:hypothetical protein